MTKRTLTTKQAEAEMAERRKAKSAERIKLVAYLHKHPGPHSVYALSIATGIAEKVVRRRMAAAQDDSEVVNTAEPHHPARWQHIRHAEIVEQANRVNRRDPICNAGMPNGSREYWAKHMAAFNDPPRGISAQ